MGDTIEIRKLHFEPGDILLVKMNIPSGYPDACMRLHDSIRASIPDWVKILIVDDTVDISKIGWFSQKGNQGQT